MRASPLHPLAGRCIPQRLHRSRGGGAGAGSSTGTHQGPGIQPSRGACDGEAGGCAAKTGLVGQAVCPLAFLCCERDQGRLQHPAGAFARSNQLCVCAPGLQVMSQSLTISDQGRQLDAARMASGQEVSASEARLRALQQGAHSCSQQQPPPQPKQCLFDTAVCGSGLPCAL